MRFVSTAFVMMAMALMLLALTYLTTTSGPSCWRVCLGWRRRRHGNRSQPGLTSVRPG